VEVERRKGCATVGPGPRDLGVPTHRPGGAEQEVQAAALLLKERTGRSDERDQRYARGAAHALLFIRRLFSGVPNSLGSRC